MTKNVTFLYQTLTYLVHTQSHFEKQPSRSRATSTFSTLRANQPSLNHDGGHKMAISLHIFFSSGRNNGVTTKRTRSSHFFMLLSLQRFVYLYYEIIIIFVNSTSLKRLLQFISYFNSEFYLYSYLIKLNLGFAMFDQCISTIYLPT